MKILRAAAALILLVLAGSPGAGLAEHARNEIREQLRSDESTAEVVGRVVKIDHAQGAIVLETAGGLLELQGPPEALEAVSVGDVVRVLVALRDRGVTRPPID
jgi:hypothetical protein